MDPPPPLGAGADSRRVCHRASGGIRRRGDHKQFHAVLSGARARSRLAGGLSFAPGGILSDLRAQIPDSKFQIPNSRFQIPDFRVSPRNLSSFLPSVLIISGVGRFMSGEDFKEEAVLAAVKPLKTMDSFAEGAEALPASPKRPWPAR